MQSIYAIFNISSHLWGSKILGREQVMSMRDLTKSILVVGTTSGQTPELQTECCRSLLSDSVKTPDDQMS